MTGREEDRNAWLEPGAFEVAPGVHRIPLPLPNDGLHAVNVYALRDADGLVLIDSGWALDESRQQLEKALGLIGFDLRSITRFLVTHVHRDHYTQAVVLRKLFGARVALGIDERDTLEYAQHVPWTLSPVQIRRLEAAGAAHIVQQIAVVAREPDPGRAEQWAMPDEWLRGGDRIRVGARTLEAVATPGHTRGHLVFHDRRNALLFAGDHVLPTITPSLGLEPVPSDSPLGSYLSSLDVVAALADSTLLPAHGPVRPSTAGRVVELQDHHRRRLDEMLAITASEPCTAIQVAQRVGWTRRNHAFADLDLFNQMLAVTETLAHLDVLVERGLTLVQVEQGIHLYG